MDVFQGEERAAGGLADLVNLHDIGMLEPGHGAGLDLESGSGRLVGATDHLERDDPVESHVSGLEDLAHPSRAQSPEYLIIRRPVSSPRSGPVAWHEGTRLVPSPGGGRPVRRGLAEAGRSRDRRFPARLASPPQGGGDRPAEPPQPVDDRPAARAVAQMLDGLLRSDRVAMQVGDPGLFRRAAFCEHRSATSGGLGFIGDNPPSPFPNA